MPNQLLYNNPQSLYTTFYNSSTCTSTQVISLYDYSHRQTGDSSTYMANSPWVIDEWRQWNTGTATTQYYTANQIWQEWCLQGTATSITSGNYSDTFQYQLREPTEEEKKAAELAEQKRAKARRRAKSLLDSVLTEEQREYMERHGYIPVLGSKGRRYHVRTTGGASGNVALVDEADKQLGRFCVHPRSTHDGKCLPAEDQFLAQVLHIQDDEDDFLGRANVVEGVNPVPRLRVA